MLSAEHVRARRSGGELKLARLDAAARSRALQFAEALLDVTRDGEGLTRDSIKEAWASVEAEPRDKRLADGMVKLVEDACGFESGEEVDARSLRSEVFSIASEARRVLPEGDAFDAEVVWGRVARQRGLPPERLRSALYSDLKGAQRLLTAAPGLTPERLLERYEAGQLAAVLLRAVRVVAELRGAEPEAYRSLFRGLKFRRLLHRIEPLHDGVRIAIDGPHSVFGPSTKYGLQLALVLPALCGCGDGRLEAELRWGKDKTPLIFRHQWTGTRREAPATGDDVPSEIEALMESFRALSSPWQVAPATRVLELPGIGLCVPDLTFTHQNGTPVLFELMGYWSRDALWKRVELCEAGLPERLLVAASTRLRVSESVLQESERASLYTFKGVMSARAVLRKLDALI